MAADSSLDYLQYANMTPDQRRQAMFAQSLMQQGAQTGPTASPWAAASRALAGTVGGWLGGQARAGGGATGGINPANQGANVAQVGSSGQPIPSIPYTGQNYAPGWIGRQMAGGMPAAAWGSPGPYTGAPAPVTAIQAGPFTPPIPPAPPPPVARPAAPPVTFVPPMAPSGAAPPPVNWPPSPIAPQGPPAAPLPQWPQSPIAQQGAPPPSPALMPQAAPFSWQTNAPMGSSSGGLPALASLASVAPNNTPTWQDQRAAQLRRMLQGAFTSGNPMGF